MSNVIQQLKDNRTAFGWMDQELQDNARRIGKDNFQCAPVDKTCLNWDGMVHNDKPFYAGLTYRLRPDYEETPDVVECEVFTEDGILRFTHDEDHHSALVWAPNRPDFIGFKYEDGSISSFSRLYQLESGDTQYVYYPIMGDCEVLTPTHVLFRGQSNA